MEPVVPFTECAAAFDRHNGDNARAYVVRFGRNQTDFVLCDGCRDELRETFEVVEKADPDALRFALFPSRRRVERHEVQA